MKLIPAQPITRKQITEAPFVKAADKTSDKVRAPRINKPVFAIGAVAEAQTTAKKLFLFLSAL